jgi:hypothetical protein
LRGGWGRAAVDFLSSRDELQKRQLVVVHLEVEVDFQVELVVSQDELARTCSQEVDVVVVHHLHHQVVVVVDVDLV